MTAALGIKLVGITTPPIVFSEGTQYQDLPEQ